MQLTTIRIDKPDATNFILGQTASHRAAKEALDEHPSARTARAFDRSRIIASARSGRCLAALRLEIRGS
jgi:hypothetical protein